ncbi:UNVERIFIED_CONTAM: hypothetical protein HDU68_010193 [Siphonaria sp. JEL0065]|nr:hypothetical protein HDU68_010193 [Siphonaria sp. JEL0065]
MSVVVMENSQTFRDTSKDNMGFHSKSASVPNTSTQSPTNHDRRTHHPVAPGYGKTFTLFISQILYIGGGEAQILFLNILEITRIPLPVVTLAVKYIQRLRRLRGVNAVSVPGDETRIFSVALILAQKYSDDTPYGNRMWGKVLGLSSLELTRLEISFLTEIGYNLCIPEREYSSFCRGVQALAREWNASLLSLEEVQVADQSANAESFYPSHPLHNQPLRIVTSGTSKHHHGAQSKQSLQTPLSSTESLADNTNDAETEEKPPMTPQETSPPPTITTRTEKAIHLPHSLSNSLTPLILIKASLLPPSCSISVATTPTPATLDDFLANAPKTYGLVSATGSATATTKVNLGASPSLSKQACATSKLILSPLPIQNVFLNQVQVSAGSSAIAGSAASYYLVATPQFVLLPRSGSAELSQQYIHIATAISRAQSRAASPEKSDDESQSTSRSTKRAKYV